MTNPTPSSPTARSPHRAEDRLRELGITLPTPAAPVAAYVPTRIVPSAPGRALVHVAGQIPFRDGVLIATGSVPDRISLDSARQCARQCGLNVLAAVRAAVGSLDRVVQVVRVGVFVACPAGFPDHPKVANGASELFLEVFGEAGRHARAAVGASSLPLDAPVEVEATFEVETA